MKLIAGIQTIFTHFAQKAVTNQNTHYPITLVHTFIMSSTSVDSTSGAANKDRTCHILKHNDNNDPIIEGLKDEILESDDDLKNIPMQDLFPVGSM